MSALCDLAKRYGPLVGRMLMALIFLQSGIGKMTTFGTTAAAMAAKGMPMTEVLLVGAIAFEIVGAALLIMGWHTRWAALALIIFLIPATFYFHNYWTFPEKEARNQRNHFMKNVTILGALIFVIGTGPGPLSVDNRRRRRGQRELGTAAV